MNQMRISSRALKEVNLNLQRPHRENKNLRRPMLKRDIIEKLCSL